MTSKWLSKFVAAECVRAGALRDHVATFATALAGHGYAESTRKEYVRLAAEFGRWLDRKDVRVTEVDERSVAEFLAHLRRRGRAARSHRATLRTLVSSLRAPDVAGPVGAEDPKNEANPIAEIECAIDWKRPLQLAGIVVVPSFQLVWSAYAKWMRSRSSPSTVQTSRHFVLFMRLAGSFMENATSRRLSFLVAMTSALRTAC